MAKVTQERGEAASLRHVSDPQSCSFQRLLRVWLCCQGIWRWVKCFTLKKKNSDLSELIFYPREKTSSVFDTGND